MAEIKNKLIPAKVYHPSETLKERLDELGMSVKEFSVKANKPEQTIIKILDGKGSITPDMAVQFENVLKMPASLWLKLQFNYDEFIARLKRKKVIEAANDWARSFPYAEMAKKGWVVSTRKVEEKVIALFDFFGVSNSIAWENYYYGQKLKVNFRISLRQTQESFAVSAWLRQGEIQSSETQTPEYSEALFKQSLPIIKQLMAEHPDDFFHKLQKLCLDCGVKVIHTPNLPKAPIHGSTRWINNTPIIQLSARRKQNDGFWFTFFHEVGHILLHGKKYISIENISYIDIDKAKEAEADAFAIQQVFTEKQEKEVVKFAFENEGLEENDILDFAEKFGTHPAIIIGRLQYKEYIPYSKGRKFIKSINLEST